MNSQEAKKYTIEVLKQGFPNKKTLDKLSTSDSGNLLFDGKEIKGGGSGSVVVDDKLDLKSENPVQNKVIAASLNGIDTLLDYILGNEIETSNIYKIFDGAGIGEGGALE